MSRLTAGVKDLSVKQPSKPKGPEKDPKYDAGRLLLKKLEDYGMFKNLPKPGFVHTAPTIIETETRKKGKTAPRVDIATTVKTGSRSVPPAEKKTATQAPSKAAPEPPAANQKAGPKDLKPAKTWK